MSNETIQPTEPKFPLLEQETRPCVPTAQAAHYLTLQPQTLREWACYGKYPAELRPMRIGRRLAWPVAGIRALLGVAHAQ